MELEDLFVGCSLDKNITVIEKCLDESACSLSDILDFGDSGFREFFMQNIKKVYIDDSFIADDGNGKVPKDEIHKQITESKKVPEEDNGVE